MRQKLVLSVKAAGDENDREYSLWYETVAFIDAIAGKAGSRPRGPYCDADFAG